MRHTGILSLTKSTYRNITLRLFTSWKKEFSEQKVTGFSVEQMFAVVSDVENYEKFLPFCQKSVVFKRTEKELLGELQVGFPPFMESYISKVTLQAPYLVKADCTDGRLFHHLTTTWRFTRIHHPRNKEIKENQTRVYFYISFEFRSLLHSQIANIFFEQLVTQMKTAFITEAEKRYGLSSLPNIDPPA